MNRRTLVLLVLLIFIQVTIQAVYPVSATQSDSFEQAIISVETTERNWMIEWNAEGTILAAATDDGVKFYNQQLQLVSEILPAEMIIGLSWKPDGTQIAFTHETNIEIWNWHGATQTASLHTILANSDEQIGIFWSPDRERLAAIAVFECIDEIYCLSRINIWSTETFQISTQLPDEYLFQFKYGSYPSSRRVSWAKNEPPLLAIIGNTIYQEGAQYFAGSDTSVFVINTDTGDTINQIEVGIGLLVDWQPRTSNIVVGGLTSSLIYDTETEAVSYFSEFMNEPKVVAWSPNGRYVVSDNKVLDSESSDLLGTLGEINSVIAVDWHPSGNWVTTNNRHEIKIYDVSLLLNFIPESVSSFSL